MRKQLRLVFWELAQQKECEIVERCLVKDLICMLISNVKAVYENLAAPSPKNHFIVGIHDDVTGSSLSFDESFCVKDKASRALFHGLGADGTVGANKNTIKIIGKETKNYAQGYFAYDSKKSGSMTISHLRFGRDAIHSPYLLSNASFVACHNELFLEKYDMLSHAEEGGAFLLNTR